MMPSSDDAPRMTAERIRLALDVEGPDAVGERVLRLGFRLARETDLAARRCFAALELVDARSQGRDAALGIAQLALERVELEEGARRLVVELRVLSAKPIGLRPKRVRIVRAGGAGDQRQAGCEASEHDEERRTPFGVTAGAHGGKTLPEGRRRSARRATTACVG